MKLLKMLASSVKASVIVLVLFGALALEAANVSWNGTEGPFDSVEIWPNSKLPVKGDDALLYSSANMGTKTVTMTNDWTTALKRLRFRPADGATFVFDGTGYEFVQPDLDPSETVYESTSFKFDINGTYDDFFTVYSAGLTGYAYLGTWRLTNPVFSTYTDGNGGQYLVFSAGTYNFYDPNGTVIGASNASKVRFGGAVAAKAVVRFEGKDTVFKCGDFDYMVKSKDNLLEFADGTYSIFGSFASNGATHDMAAGAGAIHRVRVTDGATLNIGGTTQLYLNSGRDSANNDAKYSWLFEVLNGATLNTTGRFYTYRSTNGVMRVENATWNAPGTGVYDSHAIDIGYAADDYAYSTKQKLVLVNATLTCGVKHATGNFHVGRLVSATKRTAGSVYATNSVLTFKGICSYNCGTSILKDCTATYSGNQNYSLVVTGDGDVTLDGGTSKNMGGPRLGSSSYSAVGPILRIKDGDHESGNESMLGWGSDLAANASVTATIHQTGGKYTATYETFCNEAQPAHFILEGGTLLIMTVRGGAKTHAKVPTKGGWAHFTANGGTVQCNGIAEYPAGTRHAIFYGLDRCEAGPKGLNLFLGWQQPFIKQDITNMEGTRGRFAVSCSGGGAPGVLKVTVPSKWDVAETVVEKGVTFLCQPNDTETGASVAFETDMILRPGAKFSTAGGITQVALNTLAATNATIVLDPGDVITVKDALRLRNVTFAFTSDLAENDSVDFLVYEGERTPEVEAVLKSLPFGQTLADGKCTDVELTTDAAGKTKATVTVRDKPMLGGETTWTGPGSDWNSGDNWSAGVPDGTNTAVFADNAAPGEVTLSAPAVVGALSFLGGAYTIGGASLLDFAAFDNSFVSVESGDHEIATPIGLRTAVPLAVESNATLEVSGPVYGGGFWKTGHGAATLSGENLFAGEVTSGGGLLIAGSERAIGGASTLNLGDGTLRIPEGCELVPDDALTLCVNSTNTKGAVVLDNAEDITVSSYSAKSGALVKRGKGRLVLDATAGKIGNLTVSKGNGYDDGGFSGSDGNVFAFDEDGTPPTHGFGGFSVAGGEVVIRSTAETPTKVNSTKGAIHVGLYTSTDCGAQPSLTLDHVNLEAFAYYQNLYIGRRGGRKDDFTTNSTVRVLNGSTLRVSAVMLGYPWDNNTTADNRPTLAVTNSTVNSEGVFGLSQLRAGGGAASILTFGSNLTTPDAFSISGSTTSRITGTRMSGKDDAYGKLSVDQYGRGEALFDGGTVLKVDTVATPAANNYYRDGWTKMLTLAFDDATWDFGDKDLAIGSTQFYLPLRRFEMRGKGMTLPVPATRTFHTDVTFMGSGDFTKTGAGTVEFGENAYAFTGTSHVEEGVLDLSAAGTVNNAAFAGAGTVRGATFGTGVRIDPGIGTGWSVAAAPTLDSCVFNGIVRIAVDPAVAASLTLPSPPIAVAKFTGTKPNLSKLRLAKSWNERNVGAKFTADDSGNILMTADRIGLLMIVR